MHTCLGRAQRVICAILMYACLGILGAAIALVIAAVTLIFLFFDEVYRYAVIGAAIWFALGIVYFIVHGRKHLVRSPEEEFALRALGHEVQKPSGE